MMLFVNVKIIFLFDKSFNFITFFKNFSEACDVNILSQLSNKISKSKEFIYFTTYFHNILKFSESICLINLNFNCYLYFLIFLFF